MTETGPRTGATSRRHVLVLGAAGVASAASGCAVYGVDDEQPPAADPPAGDGAPEGEAGAGADVVASTGEVAVGGGLILADQQLVITQPTEGDFRGFSAVCTHQGCTVSAVRDGTIDCACHGSRYSIEDGSVVQAASGLTPESRDPLPEVAVSVDGDQISVTG
ncbi:Rieske (2Fe-2S) protein [Myceligenerans sp. TRM 65318]|uniref:Rieske (2Fe-2S) protein n=2 Tax=Myceligenerans pegani TaxID=2776917 RepID=A0ABR9MS46_9MICO|nr:Rieske (2Fe-2S) protein [Myceligenerans sp. TRM 65318]MBE3016475.1 Rieske (2Fe-2S) protein [Myceligenerans sp. TRM 65318]